MRAARRDSNEPDLIKVAKALNGLWIPSGEITFDGILWNRRCWNLLEIKRPNKEGHKDEFTDDQVKLMIKLKEHGAPLQVIRTEDDMLALMGARRSA